jgi:hypothetical protein
MFDPLSGGVIAYLTARFGGNVHDLGVVKISSVSSFSPGGASDPEHAADFASDSWMGTRNEPNSWLCHNFKSRQVIPTRYHVRSYAYGEHGWCHLKNWFLEGSNDSGGWGELDRRENNDVLNDGNALGRLTSRHQSRFSGSGFARLVQTTGMGLSRGADFTICCC